jgi:protein phosphatase
MDITAESVGLTDVGRVRTHNEDGFLVSPEDQVYCVVDGMGGSSSGEVATEITLAAMIEYRRASLARGDTDLGSAVQLANRRILERSKSDRGCWGIGAAIAALSIDRRPGGTIISLAHVGDCRIYRYRALELTALTRDHSLINEYDALMAATSPEDRAKVPARDTLPRNVITRALGMKPDLSVDMRTEPARAGDLYLLCTDGIHVEIDDAAIGDILRAHVTLVTAAQALVQAALDHGGADNLAVVLVKIGLR